MASSSETGGPWAELGDEDVRHAFGGSAVVNDAFQKLKDELERVLGESVATAQEADRVASDLRHKVEEHEKTIDALRSLDESRERYVVWLKGVCGRARPALAGYVVGAALSGESRSAVQAVLIDMQSL